MGKVLKWIGIVIGGLLVILVLAVGVVYFLGNQRLHQNPNVGHTVTIPTSAEAVARGEYLVKSVMGCEGCHGEGFKGNMFFDPAIDPSGPPFGTLYAPNLTTGVGGVGGMSDDQFERAIRHGIGNDDRTLFIMPAHEYTHLSDEDFGALVAYLRTIPPVDNPTKPRDLTPVATLFAGAGMLGQMPYEMIDQSAAHVPSMAADTSAAYGEYLSHLSACRDCHGVDLTGAQDPGSGAVTPNITGTGEPGQWTAEQFLNTLHTGVTPSGRQLSQDMPWMVYGTMDDNDLTAIYTYLQSLK